MSEDRKPQKGDRVRVTYEATYVRAHDIREGCHVVRVPDDTNTRVTLASASLEVLEPADDPSKDPIGTVRQSPAGVVVVKPSGAFGWKVVWDCGATDRDYYADHDVAGWVMCQPVAYTPAAEALEPEVIDAKTLFPPPSGTATPPLSDFSKHLSHTKVSTDGCKQCQATRAQPREFESDGDEPPEDVKVVISVHCSDRPSPYFIRRSDGWECSDRAVGSGSGARVPWSSTQFYGLGSTFMEVLP